MQPAITEVNGAESDIDDEQLDEDEILRDQSNDKIFVRGIIKSMTTKTGKKKRRTMLIIGSSCAHIVLKC